MASLNQISLQSGLIFYLGVNTLFLYRFDIVLLCPCLLLIYIYSLFLAFFPLYSTHCCLPKAPQDLPIPCGVTRKLSLCAPFGYLWLGEVLRLDWATPEIAVMFAQEGDHGRWALHRVHGSSVELATTFLHAVMRSATAGYVATETWSSASIMPRYLRHGGSSTQKHPHDMTIKGSGGCSTSPASAHPGAAALVG